MNDPAGERSHPTTGRRQVALRLATLTLLPALLLALATIASLAPLPASLAVDDIANDAGEGTGKGTRTRRLQVLAAGGEALNRTYGNHWNFHDQVALYEIPPLLRTAFLGAEDRRFHEHDGVDWAARFAAIVQNLRALRAVRGASTISEQSVRMLYPRPRSIWSRWLEGFDAMRLQRRFGKSAVFEFYLNQVPYAANRRGVVQAARHYFNRDLQTLSVPEMLTLAVLVRAPSRLDLRRHRNAARAAVHRLAEYLADQGQIDRQAISSWTLTLSSPALELSAVHAVRHALKTSAVSSAGNNNDARHVTGSVLRTSLDADTQRTARRLLRQRLAQLRPRGARHGALLVADHQRGAIRAWVSSSAPGLTASDIDAVLSPRQPGSTLKPFVYAMALENGWHAATLIDDAPFAQSVGNGQHAYRNYSRVHHGAVSVRVALGNSLNVPAVKALAQVGAPRMLQRLRALGLRSLDDRSEHYGDGLALGNGEVTLLELAGAYAALARGGLYRPLQLLHEHHVQLPVRVMDNGVSAIVSDILADPNARAIEFGSGGVLSLPVETAVKTGTSNDHRDAWAIGFDHQHVVAVWMGDLQRRPMDRVSGASGPALVMRAVFAHLNRNTQTRALHKPRNLQRLRICASDGFAPHAACTKFREEWFTRANLPRAPHATATPFGATRIRQPGPGLRLAIDPRIPRAAQRFRFVLSPISQPSTVHWYLDGKAIRNCSESECLWTLQPGTHTLFARVRRTAPGNDADIFQQTPEVSFHVH